MEDRRTVTREELARAMRFALFTVLLTAVPYLVAFARAGEDWVFTGFLIGVDDGNSYIAKMLTGTMGAWAFRTPYSTFPQNGLFGVFLPYLLLGKLAGGAELHLQLVILFQLFRAAAVFLVVFATYRFIAYFETRPDYRFLGTVIATFGGGLGWFLLAIGRGELDGALPLEFYSPESFGFLSVFGFPHLSAGRGLMLLGMLAWLEGAAEDWRGAGIRAGLFWLGAGLFSPLSPAIALLICFSLLFLGLVISGPRGLLDRPAVLRSLITAGLVAGPLVVYFAVISSVDPFFKAWSARNTILSPPPLHYLLAFAPYLPFAILGARRAFRENLRMQLPALWVVLLPVLVYVPLNLQRRLADGVFVALVILVVRGMDFKSTGERVKRWSIAAVFILSSLILLALGLGTAWIPGLPAFRPSAEVAAFAALSESVAPGDVVLAPAASGNALPAFVPVYVLIGHGPETIDSSEIEPRVEAFFSGEGEAGLLEEFAVDFVLWPGVGAAPGMELVFEMDGYRVFRVNR